MKSEKITRPVAYSDGFIILNGDYDIAIDRTDSHSKIISWVMHLSEKNWVTKEMIASFISLACRKSNLDAWEHV